MSKIEEILIGTNNEGKYKEICHLLPKGVKKYSPKNSKFFQLLRIIFASNYLEPVVP